VQALDDAVLRRRARHVVTENDRVRATVEALSNRRWDTLGGLLDDSHTSLRDDFEISCAELDLAVESARTAGALGARMTGGGFGGSAVSLVPRDLLPDVRRSVHAAFVEAGNTTPAFLVATPSDPARVEVS
jgi:galactokinase